MAFDVITTTPANEEVISLEEARLHLKVDSQVDDSLITRLIKSARLHIENNYGVAPSLITVKQVADQWPDCDKPAYLLRTPASDLSAEVWRNGSWATVSGSNFFLDEISRPPRVIPASNSTLEEPDLNKGGIRFKYTAGYASGECPEDIRQAMFMLIGSMYENRQTEVVGTISSVLEHGLAMLMANYKLQPMV